MKYTNRGSVWAKLRVEGGELRAEVEDTGCGISEEDRDKLFKMLAFEEENSRHTRSGLGLTVCKNIVDAFGGHIQLSSRVDVGTKVLVQLPLQYDVLEGIENVELTDRRPNSIQAYN